MRTSRPCNNWLCKTRGKFYTSPASLAILTTAFHDAQSVASSTPSVAASTLLLANGAGTGSFVVDSTIGQLNLSLVKPSNSSSRAGIATGPNGGSVVSPTDRITVGNETLLSHVIINPPAGVWTVSAQGAGTGNSVTYTASGIPKTLTYIATVDSLSGNNVVFPAAITLRAKLFKELPINKATVSAQVIAPNGHVDVIHFHDDGAGGDELANDGNYSATYRYTHHGLYTFKVNYTADRGQSFKTYTGATASATVQGREAPPIADKPIAEAFSRANQIQITTSGGVFPAGGLGNISHSRAHWNWQRRSYRWLHRSWNGYEKVLVRAIGPSLPLAGKLTDPVLELRNSAGKLIATNDNWTHAPNKQDIIDSTVAPTNDFESAILTSLARPG